MTFDLDRASEDPARIAVIGVGKLGQQVVEECRLEQVQAQLLAVSLSNEAAITDQPALTGLMADERSTSARDGDDLGATLVFLVGELDGTLGTAVRDLAPRLAERTQALIAVAALPPSFEGRRARSGAVRELEGLAAAQTVAVVLDSDQSLRELSPTDPISEYWAFDASRMAAVIRAVTDLVTVPGEVNVDFADVLFVLRRGTAGFFASGMGTGPNRAMEAAQSAVDQAQHFPALQGEAPGCLIRINGGMDLTIDEVTTVVSIVQDAVGETAEIIFGAVHDSNADDVLTVSTLWTGYEPSTIAFEHGHSVLAGAAPEVVQIGGRRRRPTSRNLRVFLASPSDVGEEREAVKRAIDELNLQNADFWGTRLELVRWETHALPALGRTQGVVNETTDLEAIDIFVGLLWSRLGTPTGEAESGTVEEFERAYASWRKKGHPWLAFYFCDRPVKYAGVTGAEQFLRVARFREQFADKGLYFTFSTPQQLERLVFRHLSRIVDQMLTRRGG